MVQLDRKFDTSSQRQWPWKVKKAASSAGRRFLSLRQNIIRPSKQNKQRMGMRVLTSSRSNITSPGGQTVVNPQGMNLAMPAFLAAVASVICANCDVASMALISISKPDSNETRSSNGPSMSSTRIGNPLWANSLTAGLSAEDGRTNSSIDYRHCKRKTCVNWKDDLQIYHVRRGPSRWIDQYVRLHRAGALFAATFSPFFYRWMTRVEWLARSALLGFTVNVRYNSTSVSWRVHGHVYPVRIARIRHPKCSARNLLKAEYDPEHDPDKLGQFDRIQVLVVPASVEHVHNRGTSRKLGLILRSCSATKNVFYISNPCDLLTNVKSAAWGKVSFGHCAILSAPVFIFWGGGEAS